MEKIARLSTRWWFFIILVVAQFVFIPYASTNFQMEDISSIIYTTLANSFQLKIGDCNVYFQSVSILMLVLLIAFGNKMKLAFNIYVALSYILFAFLQNIAVTEKYGLSVVTVNVVMFLFVAYAWSVEVFQSKNDYSFSNFKWKHSWMIPLALFAYLCPLSADGFDFNPLQFIWKNSATAFCLTTPLFLTIMTLNFPQINRVVYRITALIGVVVGFYNMLSFLNPHTVNVGILHVPLFVISLYCCVLSYKGEKKA